VDLNSKYPTFLGLVPKFNFTIRTKMSYKPKKKERCFSAKGSGREMEICMQQIDFSELALFGHNFIMFPYEQFVDMNMGINKQNL